MPQKMGQPVCKREINIYLVPATKEKKQYWLPWLKGGSLSLPFPVIWCFHDCCSAWKRVLNSLSCTQVHLLLCDEYACVWDMCTCVFLGSHSDMAILLYPYNLCHTSLTLSTKVHHIRNRILYVSLCAVEHVCVCV